MDSQEHIPWVDVAKTAVFLPEHLEAQVHLTSWSPWPPFRSWRANGPLFSLSALFQSKVEHAQEKKNAGKQKQLYVKPLFYKSNH